MIAIINYGMGNLRSVQKSLENAGYPSLVTRDPEAVRKANGVVLPGVGAFADAIKALNTTGLGEAVKETVGRGKPLLGICLGMQLLMTSSQENGEHQGLDLIPGDVLRLPPGVKVPQMGWNSLQFAQNHPLLKGIKNNEYFYFVHSYYVSPLESEWVIATTSYGLSYCSVIAKGPIMGVQFHPEKSSSIGQIILKNFGRMM